MQLTENFNLEEFKNDGGLWIPAHIDETEAHRRYTKLAETLENVRFRLGKTPIRITSGHRTAEDQQRINPGTLRSMHCENLGVDIQAEGFSPSEVFILLTNYWLGGLGLYTTHNHLDLRNELGLAEARWRKL